MMLKEVLMYAYTLEVRDAWRAIFDFLVERMEIGMNLEYESGTLANANGTSVEGANGKLPSSHKDGPSTSGNMVENGKGKWDQRRTVFFWITIMFVNSRTAEYLTINRDSSLLCDVRECAVKRWLKYMNMWLLPLTCRC